MPSQRSHYDGTPTAFIDGWKAHKFHYPADEPNPYLENIQAQSHSEWNKGYWARRDACEHGGDMGLDDYDPRHYL